MAAGLFVGIDGGGSRARVAVVDKKGRLRGYAESGGCNPDWLPAEACRDHIHQAVREAVSAAGAVRGDIAGAVAGISGIDRPDDQEWAREFVESAGLPPPLACINDRVIAQRGALLGREGVVVIAGTGMITSAITEAGSEVVAWSFGEGGAPGAIILVRQLLARLAAEEVTRADESFARSVFSALGVAGASGLRALLLERALSLPSMARLALLVTDAAQRGTPVAKTLCAAAVTSAVRGIRLVGFCIRAEEIPVVLIGGVIRSAFIRRGVEDRLAGNGRGGWWCESPSCPRSAEPCSWRWRVWGGWGPR